MISFICKTLQSFRFAFSRTTTWILFCSVVLGFIGANEMVGITSFCRFYSVDEGGYNAFIHFFRCSSWSLAAITLHWEMFVLLQNKAVLNGERVIMLGDHTYVPKDGRRMPGVVTLRQNSETQSKPSYFRGHCWGAVCLLVGSFTTPFCLPLILSLHQGHVHIGKGETKNENKQTLITRIVKTALDISIRNGLPGILILDAYFPAGVAFKLSNSVWSIALKQPLMTLIIRAKKNYVAYFPADVNKKEGPGRPRKYGEKVKLMEVFDQEQLFQKVVCTIYGKTEEVLILSADLFWRPSCSLIKFVFAMTSRGPIVLMCSDLTMSPINALELYSKRIRIETMFDMLKNLLCVFRYRFWTKKLPAESRKPKKNKKLKNPPTTSLPTIKKCWDAYEKFVMLGVISLGLLQLISLKFSESVWNQFSGFLRSRSRDIPSERTSKIVISNLLAMNFSSFALTGILLKIQDYFFRKKISRQKH
ncbi:conserved hypothetical protein, membrane [Candidatus Magnetomorum sp. HK-1]|nr:conserved hypothetical protein, membrane [Candidatus Magnetomorum sp. HK-1]